MNLLAVGAGLLLLPPVGLVVWQMKRWGSPAVRRLTGTSSGRLVLAVLFALGISITVQLAFTLGKPAEQAFASFGAIKKITLPLIYLAFVFALLSPQRRAAMSQWGAQGEAMPAPWWWKTFFTVSLISAVLEIADPRQPMILSSVAQGWLLLGGILLFSYTGATSQGWSPTQELAIFLGLLSAAILECSTGNSMGVFVASTFPVCLACVYAAARSQSLRGIVRVVFGIVGVLVCSIQASRLFTDPTSSTAERMQFAVSMLVLVLAIMPRRIRIILGPLALAGATYAVASSGLGALMRGHYDGVTDVTLEQRGYETSQVLSLVKTDPASWLFGTGPGGTVDLSACPDWATLLAAGRNLPAVDDVHLLSSWMLLKTGFLGLGAFVLLVIGGIREIAHLMNKHSLEYFDVLLIMLFGSGLVMALPAATHFFANPMPTLALGILYGRRARPRSRNPA